MFVDGYMLLAIYLLAVLAAAISIYALWTLEEIKQEYEKKNKTKPSNAWDHYHNKAKELPKSKKGHWD
jgi:flagellar basal body-associated protein FliL